MDGGEVTALLPSLRPWSRCDPTELARWAFSDEAGLFRDGELGRSRRASCGCVLRTHVRTRVVWWCWCSSLPSRRALLAGSRDGPARMRRTWWRTRSLEAGLLRLLRAAHLRTHVRKHARTWVVMWCVAWGMGRDVACTAAAERERGGMEASPVGSGRAPRTRDGACLSAPGFWAPLLPRQPNTQRSVVRCLGTFQNALGRSRTS